MPTRIGGIEFGKTFEDGQAVAIRFQGIRRLALRPQRIGDQTVGDCEVVLPARIARIELSHQVLDDHKPIAIILHCLREVLLRGQETSPSPLVEERNVGLPTRVAGIDLRKVRG